MRKPLDDNAFQNIFPILGTRLASITSEHGNFFLEFEDGREIEIMAAPCGYENSVSVMVFKDGSEYQAED